MGQCFLDGVIERSGSERRRQDGGGAPDDAAPQVADAGENCTAAGGVIPNSVLAGREQYCSTPQPYPTQEQLQNIIFQETQSYTGPWTHGARVNIAHTVLNRHDAGIVGGVGRPFGGALSPAGAAAIARGDPTSVAAYADAGRAAADALSQANDDPAGGALFFRQGKATVDPPDLARFGRVGPLDNSFPTQEIPRHAHIRFYGKRGTQPDF